MHILAKVAVAAAVVAAVAYEFYRFGYDSGYFDAVKEHLDKLGRRSNKNWSKCLGKYAEKRKEDNDGKGDSGGRDGGDDRVRGDGGQQESVGQDSVR